LARRSRPVFPGRHSPAQGAGCSGTLDRHPTASTSSLIPSLSGRRCSPHARFPNHETLTAERP
jgi:hypothetical protein